MQRDIAPQCGSSRGKPYVDGHAPLDHLPTLHLASSDLPTAVVVSRGDDLECFVFVVHVCPNTVIDKIHQAWYAPLRHEVEQGPAASPGGLDNLWRLNPPSNLREGLKRIVWPAVVQRLLRAGERGVLFVTEGDKQVILFRWDEIKSIKTLKPTDKN